jgi:hypothetical protein
MPKQYKVIERCGDNEWTDSWKSGELPIRFNTIEEAEKEIQDFLDEEILTDKGLITMKENDYSSEDFKIVTANTPPHPE